MSKHIIGYVVVVTRDDESRHYMASDYASGGYKYWTDNAMAADRFDSVDQAVAAVRREESSSSFSHGASDASYANPDRTFAITVEALEATRVDSLGHQRFHLSVPKGLLP